MASLNCFIDATCSINLATVGLFATGSSFSIVVIIAYCKLHFRIPEHQRPCLSHPESRPAAASLRCTAPNHTPPILTARPYDRDEDSLCIIPSPLAPLARCLAMTSHGTMSGLCISTAQTRHMTPQSRILRYTSGADGRGATRVDVCRKCPIGQFRVTRLTRFHLVSWSEMCVRARRVEVEVGQLRAANAIEL